MADPIWDPIVTSAPGYYDSGDAIVTTNMTTVRGTLGALIDYPPDTSPANEFYISAKGTNPTTWMASAANVSDKTVIAPATEGNVGNWIKYEFPDYTSAGHFVLAQNQPFDFGNWLVQGSQTGEDGLDVWDTLGVVSLSIYGPPGTVYSYKSYPLPAYPGAIARYIYPPGPEGQTPSDGAAAWTASLYYKFFRIIGVDNNIKKGIWNNDPSAADAYAFRGLFWQAREAQDRVARGPAMPYNGVIPPARGYDGGPPYVDPNPTDDVENPTPPPSDYFSPYSRGARAIFSGSKGNGLLASWSDTFSANFGGIEQGFDNKWNNGPYYIYNANQYAQIAFDNPVLVTAFKLYGEFPANIGSFYIQAGDGTTFVTVSSTQVVEYLSATDPNGRFPTPFELVVDKTFGAHTHYRLVAASSYTGRIANEIYVKVAHSELEGGDRRAGDNSVITTSTLDAQIQGSGTPLNGDFSRLMNGQINDAGGGFTIASPILLNRPPMTGEYFQFVFARKVQIDRGFLTLYQGSEETVGNTLWGTWQWQVSNDEGLTYVNAGSEFTFLVDANQPPLPNDTDDISGYWRLVKTATTASTLSGIFPYLYQIEFDLTDSGVPIEIPDPPNPPLVIDFVDDAMLSVAVTIQAGTPFAARFTDDAMLTATPTIIRNRTIAVSFSDNAELTIYSDLSPTAFGQFILIATGR